METKEKTADIGSAAQLETSSTEKYDVASVDQEASSVGFSREATKKLLRKADLALLPFLALLYLLSFLDRTNIGNAKLARLEDDLGMNKKGYDYSIAVAVFFPFYVAAEIPSNMAMKRFRPSIWIPSIMVAWGICTVCLGLVHNFAGLLVVRCALGIAEGGLFPGITY
jgi:MFS family permease